MAAELVTPVDEFTGLPLPLLPPKNAPPKNSPEIEWHHHFHPRKHPLLEGLGGIAIRTVRLQSTYRREHTNYHRHYIGPPLPELPEEQFQAVIMAYAGYIPEQAINTRRDEPRLVSVPEDLRRRLWETDEIQPTAIHPVRAFLTEYILGQNMSHIYESVIDEFVHTLDIGRRYYLGSLILAKAIERATEPTDNMYRQAWQGGLIPAYRPAKSPTFVSRTLSRAPKQRQHLLKRLQEKLAS